MAVLLTNPVLTAYLVIGTFLEERKLVVEFGDQYRQYQREVPMLFPVKWMKKALTTDIIEDAEENDRDRGWEE